jgi:predicted dehydrogenase
MERRTFIKTSGLAAAGGMLLGSADSERPDRVGTTCQSLISGAAKLKLALVGTGIRGTSCWGKPVMDGYGDLVEFVGLCDINPGRVAYAKKYMGVACNTYTDFDLMMKETKPDMLIVTTVDATHNQFIVKGLEYGADVLTEKPLTTDEIKCQQILDAQRRTGKKVRVGFNYRYGTLFTAIKQALEEQRAGRITSVDFHWYLNTYHGADYFRRWHGYRNKSGSLLVHKASHHFDLLNWWIDSDPVEVNAYGKLEHYGRNNAFRGDKCRTCDLKQKCKFYWDITADPQLVQLYVENEKYDGYIRDNCLWRTDIDIFDKMAVQIRYANDVQVSYSLTAYSPYEGLTIAFNGMKGRIDSWQDLPWRTQEKVSQADRHKREMSQGSGDESGYDEIVVSENFGKSELVKVPMVRAGHGGGDDRLRDDIFRPSGTVDPLKHAAGLRDGVMAILIGIAARKSIDEGRPVKIEELSDLKPGVERNAS